ncbi:sensor histidine kinase [Spartinivicinus ruber]|uniref:sensor histidine kinase n=1 Tax=Spartinivicinus ruber TaxID=2683272 RepID=UPI0013D844A7|nr:ATP-binding protein [Spartinivicinus ruber]
MVADLLEISLVENHIPSLRAVDLTNLVQDTLKIYEQTIAEKNTKVYYDQLPTVWSDPVLLYRVFQNIISNAIKFHKDDSNPRIEIKASLEGAFWQITICDNGIGIDSQHYNKVFEFFNKLNTRADYVGSGVGLAFCKKSIESIGGSIWIKSQPDKGSCIYFTLPRNVT